MNKSDVESCIMQVTKEFRKATWNFQWEANFHHLLFHILRNSKKGKIKVNRLHSEFPTHSKSKIKNSGEHDLVILTHGSALLFRKHYGEPTQKWRDKMKFEHVFEIKFRHANAYLPSDKGIGKDLRRLREVLDKGISKSGYMLIFIDKDVTWSSKKYRDTENFLKKSTNGIAGLSVYCIPGKKGETKAFKSGKSAVKSLD